MTDLSSSDAWKQGVEIRSFKVYDAGVVKIYSGEPGHAYRRLNFGRDFLTDVVDEPWEFNDTDVLPTLAELLYSRTITRRLVTNVEGNGSLIDVLEPISKTRTIVTTLDRFGVPLKPRNGFHSALMSGNETGNMSELTLSVDDFSVVFHASPHVDNTPQDRVFDDSFVINNVIPFSDRSKVVVSHTMPTQMVAATMFMTGSSSDYYISDRQRSGNCGNTYENTPMGTDSIAFGGMMY